MKKNILRAGVLMLSVLLALCVAGCTNQGSGNTDTGVEGWYTLTEKTVDGNDITNTFITNTVYLKAGKATLFEATAVGASEQEGTYTVEGDTINILVGVKTYKYEYNKTNQLMTYSGKVNRQQVVMTYKYSADYEPHKESKGVAFTSELFGESLNENFYNYCPTAFIENNNTLHIWYCSNKVSGNVTDYVAYRKGTLNADGKWTFSEKKLVLEPTAGTWDSRHVCDPSVVKGSFHMKGESYSYLMAYLGCYTSNVTCNEVGIAVAKNPEGPWVKVDSLNPIANFYMSEDYNASSWGYGQPSVISADGEGKILLFYTKGVKSGTYCYVEEWDLSNIDDAKLLREKRVSDSGVVNASGQVDVINNADFAYDPQLNRLYVVKEDFPYADKGGTNWLTAGNTVLYIDLGEKGLDTLFGEYIWNVCGKVTAQTTGYKRAHNMGFMTDAYGRLQSPYEIPVIYTRSDESNDYPEWSARGQWPALHTYRLYGTVIETK